MVKMMKVKRPNAVVIAVLGYGAWVWAALGGLLLWVGFNAH
jgi:hypothetical protein